MHALEIGADDYLVKPFSMKELVARVKAAVRRGVRAQDTPRGDAIEIEELRIDPREVQAFVDGASAELTPTEFKLLYTLALERGRVVTRDELLQRIWGRRQTHRDRTVDVFVRRLRDKIDKRAPRSTPSSRRATASATSSIRSSSSAHSPSVLSCGWRPPSPHCTCSQPPSGSAARSRSSSSPCRWRGASRARTAPARCAGSARAGGRSGGACWRSSAARGSSLAGDDGVFSGTASAEFYAVFAVKVALVAALVAGAFVHDFVLGPGLARQIRAGRQQTLRRPLVVVGWTNFALTLIVPVLGTVLAHLG